MNNTQEQSTPASSLSAPLPAPVEPSAVGAAPSGGFVPALSETQLRAEVRKVVHKHVFGLAKSFREKRVADMKAGGGLLEKLGNQWYRGFPYEFAAGSTVSRSFDSALGGMLQRLAVDLARLNFDVLTEDESYLPLATSCALPELTDDAEQEEVDDKTVRRKRAPGQQCDMVLTHRATGAVSVIEVKAGGKLDKKKAQAEKQALTLYTQAYAKRHGVVPRLYLGVTYDAKAAEGKRWESAPVRNVFSDDELLIGRQFWDFVCQHPRGDEFVLAAYDEVVHLLVEAVDAVSRTFQREANKRNKPQRRRVNQRRYLVETTDHRLVMAMLATGDARLVSKPSTKRKAQLAGG